MGYELYITRRELWSNDELQERDISLDEWLKYIDNDPDLELSDAYRIKVPGSENESQVAPGFCEWLAHPKNKRPWFDYSYGSISTKNPDEETIKKMLSISKTLNAKVQGDDGEIYELTPDNKISYRHLFDEDNKIFYTNPIDADDKDINSSTENKKPWWKFW